MIREALDCLAVRADGVYVDCTLGGGGHAAAIYSRLSSAGHLIALDRDQDAILAGGSALRATSGSGRLNIFRTDFAGITAVLDSLGIKQVDGILADLGVSSWQLDQKERGFSYRAGAPLDMRMDKGQKLDAYTVVNTYAQDRLTDILRRYGEERYAGRISQAIVRQRLSQPIRTTDELADLICRAMPGSARKEEQHPARRTFQAIRIEVNHELDSLDALLRQAPLLLADKGRICVISFHSLEDRMVKDAFRSWENPCTCPREFPVCVCGKKPLGKSLVRRGQIAGGREKTENPRSSSARLRCFARSYAREVNS